MTVTMMTDSSSVSRVQDLDSSPLGAFRHLWDAWNAAHEVMVEKDLTHFTYAWQRQVEELTAHDHAGKNVAAAQEAVDIISIALNYLRRLGYTPSEIAELTRDRAAKRMDGQTTEILKKYP
jgi:hypothetical protein